jgi:hypothetical protein
MSGFFAYLEEGLDSTKKVTKKSSRKSSKEIRLELLDLQLRVERLEDMATFQTAQYTCPPVMKLPVVVTSNTTEA